MSTSSTPSMHSYAEAITRILSLFPSSETNKILVGHKVIAKTADGEAVELPAISLTLVGDFAIKELAGYLSKATNCSWPDVPEDWKRIIDALTFGDANFPEHSQGAYSSPTPTPDNAQDSSAPLVASSMEEVIMTPMTYLPLESPAVEDVAPTISELEPYVGTVVFLTEGFPVYVEKIVALETDQTWVHVCTETGSRARFAIEYWGNHYGRKATEDEASRFLSTLKQVEEIEVPTEESST